jgi:NADPH-dependent ferric siderophore reductase
VVADSYFRAEVRERTWLTPHMIRVRFGCPSRPLDGAADLADFRSTGVGDERLVVVFPAAGEAEPPAPVLTPTGWDYPDPATRPEMRSYTVRAFDPVAQEMLVDFVAHEGGVAAEWARRARTGDVVLLTEAAGWYDPPADAAWQLLVADMAALPALSRICETTALPTSVIAEVLEPADRQPLPARVEARWLCGTGNGTSPSALLRALRDVTWPDGPGYVWFAGEAAESRAVRKHLRHHLGFPVERYDVLGYWRVGQEEWNQRYAAISADLEHVYTEALARGLSSTDALEVYDAALERVGL